VNYLKKIKRLIFWALYSYLMKHLPGSSRPFGFIGKYGRRFSCEKLFSECGENINIERGADFGSGKYITIGDRSGIGVDCILSGEINIGNDVMMGPECVLLSRNHTFKRLDIPMNKQGYEKIKPITICDDVWIGYGVIILGGIDIGEGSIIGAGSVVTKNVTPYTIVGGNPARKIGNRK